MYLLVVFLLFLTFFFDALPVPVEGLEGSKNTEEFIYGGIYWTSGLDQFKLGNYFGSLGLISIFLIFLGGIYLIK